MPHAHDETVPVGWQDGFRVQGTDLWLGARRSVGFAFVPDALEEIRAARMLAAPGTAAILEERRKDAVFLPAPFERPFEVGDAEVTLHPAGTMPGGAQILLRRAGTAVLYFRRILPEPVGVGEPLAAPSADVVLVDPPRTDDPRACAHRTATLASIRAWTEAALGDGETPVLIAERHVVGPSLVVHLSSMGAEMRLHWAVYRTFRAWTRAGVKVDRAWPLDQGLLRADQIVLLPPEHATPEVLASVPRARTAFVVDAAVEPPALGAETPVFRLGFVAGVTEIAAHVQRVGARTAVLGPDAPDTLAGVLRGLGIGTVREVGPPEQLGLL
jgi:putative mRNA 3-end processing factor